MADDEHLTFEQAVAAIQAGADPAEQARALHAQLTGDERLSLLDGDTPFWPGLGSMISEG